MKGAYRVTVKLTILVFFCLGLGVEHSAAKCPLATLLPSDVASSIEDKYFTDQWTEQIAKLQQTVPGLFRSNEIDVYSVAVVYRNSTVYSAGLADTPFRIGSVTKVFTAMGALLLRKRGLLALDDPVKKYLPKFSVINPYGRGDHDITLRELMGHLSGLPRDLCAALMTCGSPSEEDRLLELIAHMELARPPWSLLPSYSNLGFELLGHAWEKATSPPKSWGDFIRDEISTPLNMSDTGLDFAHVKLAPGDCYGYPSNTSMGWAGPAGDMYSTAFDLAKFLKFLLNPNLRLLSDAEIQEWTHPTTIFPDSNGGGFALSWELRPIVTSANQSTTLITKNGQLCTYHSIIAFHPDSQLGLVVLTSSNDTTNASAGEKVAFQILSYLIPAVQSAHSKFISLLYSGIYICNSTDPIISPNFPNTTFQVLGGTINITTMTPSSGLLAEYNITLLQDGKIGSLSIRSQSLVLKRYDSHSFWAYLGSCFSIAGSLSGHPDFLRPNFPGSVDFFEFIFDPQAKLLHWPAIGAMCYKSN